MKTFRVWLFAAAASFYTTFVLQTLWNWFVVALLHLPSISYWQMFGLNLLAQMVTERNVYVDTFYDDRWKRAEMLLDACVPPEKKEEIAEKVKSEGEEVWMRAGLAVFTKLCSDSATLGIGWIVHTLIA